MKTIKRLLLGLTLGMLLVGCSADPITEDQPQQNTPIVVEPTPIIINCTYTEEIPYYIEYNGFLVNCQCDIVQYKRTFRRTNLSTGVVDIIRVETFILTTEIPQNQLNTWICN
jgi:hypothetical protein